MTQALNVGTSGGNKTATEIWVGTASGNKQVTEGWVGTASGNKQFYSSSSVVTMTPDHYFNYDYFTEITTDIYGFNIGYIAFYPAFGSITPTTTSVYAGATIQTLWIGGPYDDEGLQGQLWWLVSGTQSNSGWTTMTIGTKVFYRSAALFSHSAFPGDTLWSWSYPDVGTSDYLLFDPFYNPTQTITWA